MEINIKLSKTEAATLCNITNVMLLYIDKRNDINKTLDNTVGIKILKDMRSALVAGEKKFGFSPIIRDFLIEVLQFYYEGVGLAVYSNTEVLQGKAREMYERHYNSIPYIIKKLK